MKTCYIRTVIASGAITTALAATPAMADPSFGFGFTILKGGNVSVGAKVFSTDKPESAALSLGIDYNFDTKGFRPNLGVAYLEGDFYVDGNVGYDLNAGQLDYGLGIGGLGNMATPAAPAGGGGGGAGGGA